MISNVQSPVLAIGSHCIRVLQPRVFKGSNIFIVHLEALHAGAMVGWMVAPIHWDSCSGPSEVIPGQQGDHCDPQKSPPETRERTAVKH